MNHREYKIQKMVREMKQADLKQQIAKQTTEPKEKPETQKETNP